MLDPLPPPPKWLQNYTQPLADYLALPTLTLHVHEIILSFAFYQLIQSVVSPWLSTILFPKIYPQFRRRTRLNWDIHVVSLVQSTLINIIALWVMFADRERKDMTSGERVYGYDGACGMVQALATGYFVWDLIVSTVHVNIFGIGLWFHAISALWVFSFGFRPFLNFYAPTFILYELSSPFLNFHWFFDKVNMTGSKAQWYNGMALLGVFFSCRLAWGSWQSVCVFTDIFKALRQTSGAAALLEPFDIHTMVFSERNSVLCIDEVCARANAEISKFAHHTAAGLPLWLAATYLSSNLILNSLNFYWFSKMIETVMKRFRDPVPVPVMAEAEIKTEKGVVNNFPSEAATKLEEKGTFSNGGITTSADEDVPLISSVSETATAAGIRRRKA